MNFKKAKNSSDTYAMKKSEYLANSIFKDNPDYILTQFKMGDYNNTIQYLTVSKEGLAEIIYKNKLYGGIK